MGTLLVFALWIAISSGLDAIIERRKQAKKRSLKANGSTPENDPPVCHRCEGTIKSRTYTLKRSRGGRLNSNSYSDAKRSA